MSELLLVNPRRKRRRKSTARRNPKRKMSALQAQYFGKRRKSGGGRKRRASKRRHSVAKVARRVGRRARRAARRFGSSRSGAMKLIPANIVKGTLLPAAMGGAGAIAVDVIWGMLGSKLPANLQTGTLGTAVKAAGAIGVGQLASKFLGREIGQRVTAGYLTVLAYNLIRGMAQKAMPSLPGLSDYSMGYTQAGPYIPDGYTPPNVGAYLPDPSMGSYVDGYADDFSQSPY